MASSVLTPIGGMETIQNDTFFEKDEI